MHTNGLTWLPDPATCRSLANFELGMLGTLAIALPIVYWRKIRIRHL